ncbi:MAG: ABC transporter permease [Bacteroidota bacterium]|nr:ABC transporter permease [Bacteroidota bacterium]
MFRKLFKAIQLTADIFTSELKAVFSDAGTVLMFMIALVAYPVLYSLGYEQEIVRDVPVAVVDLDNSSLSRQCSRMADATEQLKVECKANSLKEAQNLFYTGKVKGVIVIPANFEKDILRSKSTIVSVYSDASYFLLYKQVFGGVVYSSGTLSAGVEIKRMINDGKTIDQAKDLQDPLKVDIYNLYNPFGGYCSFVMPGIIILILQQTLLIGIGILGGTSRERNLFFTLHEYVNKKGGSIPAVFGKASSYVFIYIFNALFTMVVLHRWLGLPDNTNFLTTLVLLIPFLYSVSFLGLAISVFFKERVYPILFLVFLSPILLFISGLSWPIQSVPRPIYLIGHLFPCTEMIPAYLRMRTAGAGLSQVTGEWMFILIQMVIYFIIACVSYKLAMKNYKKGTV